MSKYIVAKHPVCKYEYLVFVNGRCTVLEKQLDNIHVAALCCNVERRRVSYFVPNKTKTIGKL